MRERERETEELEIIKMTSNILLLMHHGIVTYYVFVILIHFHKPFHKISEHTCQFLVLQTF